MIVNVPPYTAPSSGGVGPVGSGGVVVAGVVVAGVVVAGVVVAGVVVAGVVVVGVVVVAGSPQPVISNPLIDIIAIRRNRNFFIFSSYLLEIFRLLNRG